MQIFVPPAPQLIPDMKSLRSCYCQIYLCLLQVGNLAYHHYFKVVSEAGLLPRTNEDVQQWRDRVIRCVESVLSIRGTIRVAHVYAFVTSGLQRS